MKDEDVMFDLFAHAGWRIFIRDQEEALQSLKLNCHLCQTMDKFHFQRGMIQALQNITAFQETYRLLADQELQDEEVI